MFSKIKTSLYALGIAVLLTAATACTTKKNTVVTRGFHNTTSRYNIYFNGKESYRNGVNTVEKVHRDKYSEILPIFKYSDPKSVEGITSDMDNVIKKSIKVVKLHSITKKPKHKRGSKSAKQVAFEQKGEYCNWVDDSYLLMGKAHVYKHEFGQAAYVFQHLIDKYPTQPTIYDAMLWRLRALNEEGEFDESRQFFAFIEGQKDFPQKKKGELDLVTADFQLKQKHYTEAIPLLEQAIEAERKKKKRARYTYILAQLYQQTGDLNKATDLYKEVIAMHPDYEMVFNAQISRAMAYENSGGSDDLQKQLLKMLKDDKNIDFRDQIYYALANIDMKNGDTPAAIENYKLSTAKSTTNSEQKAVSYLALADIYYARPQYDSAGMYYDSTMTFLSKDYKEYDKVQTLAENLSALIGSLRVVSREDSLQYMAKLSEPERNKLIDKAIRDIAETERKQAEAERLAYNQGMDTHNEIRNNTVGFDAAKANDWYFYNETMKARGQIEFARIWGDRKLEDHWRRKNKAIIASFDEATDENTDETADAGAPENDPKKREYYLKDLPKTPEDFTTSDDKIIDAMFNVAMVYREQIKDNAEARKAFEKLIKRFPENKYLLSCYYNLYQIAEAEGNYADVGKYKSKIVSEFPESNYAKMLSNPNYLRDLLATQTQVENLYQMTYSNYNNRNYTTVQQMAENAMAKYQDNLLMPNFMYLKAMADGALSPNKDKMVAGLKLIVEKYPQNEVATEARNTLALLVGDVEKAEKEAIEESLFAVNENDVHFYVIVFDKAKIDGKKLNFSIESFHFDSYKDEDFKVTPAMLTDTRDMITVKSFENKAAAQTYFLNLRNAKTIEGSYPATDYLHFIISMANFATLFENKNVAAYMRFYAKYYE